MSALAAQATTIPGLPACPAWCPGGHKVRDGDDQVHEKVIASFVAVDADSHEDAPRPVEVELFVQRYDTLKDAHLVKEPIATRAIIEYVHELDGKRRVIRAAMSATQLRSLAVGSFWASNMLDDADKAEGRTGDDDEFACCDTDPNCVHARETAARLATIRAEMDAEDQAATSLSVVRGSDTVEVFGAARLSLTKGEAANLADELHRAIGRRRRINWALIVFKHGIRVGRVLGKAKRARATR